jgi:methionyl-tRNA formyltransferase
VKVLFWGTPDFAVPTLRALGDEGHQVVGVVTQPDRPAGRGRHLRPSPVKEFAQAEGIEVLTPERPRGEVFMAELRRLDPDVNVVVAYGHILRPEVLEQPPHGSLNVHASLLPKLRGAAPVHWAIARGHDTTGISVMRMTAGMDEGPVLHTVEVPIGEHESTAELTRRLSGVGAQALIEALTLLQLGEADAREQDDTQATYAPKVNRSLARIDWRGSAVEVKDHVRAMDDVPGAWTELEGRPVKLFSPRLAPHGGGALPCELDLDAQPGTVVDAESGAGRGVGVATGDGVVWFGDVQPPGKRRMAASAWLAGRGVRPGDRFA